MGSHSPLAFLPHLKSLIATPLMNGAIKPGAIDPSAQTSLHRGVADIEIRAHPRGSKSLSNTQRSHTEAPTIEPEWLWYMAQTLNRSFNSANVPTRFFNSASRAGTLTSRPEGLSMVAWKLDRSGTF